MTSKKLLTLREIAGIIQRHHRDVIECRNILGNHVQGADCGRHDRYWSESIQFFKTVFDLRDEGYTFQLIRDILDEKYQPTPQNPAMERIQGLLASVGINFLLRTDENEVDQLRTVDNDVGGCRRMEEDVGRGRTKKNEVGGGGRMDVDGAGGRAMEQDGCGCTTRQEDEGRGVENTGADSPAPTQTDLRDELLAHCRMCREELEDDLRDVLAQINSALTRTFTVQYATTELARKGLERLAELEKDLGMDKEQLVLPQMPDEPFQIVWQDKRESGMVAKELEQMQGDEVGHLEDVTINVVMASVQDGRPDKEVVKAWIAAEKQRTPGVSYTVLAEMLDSAKIPTLRGRQGWNRGVIRNLDVGR